MKKQLFLILVTALLAVTSAFAQTPELQIYRGGSLIQSYPVSSVDSLKVGYSLAAPTAVNAQLNDNSIVVSWTAVDGATSYQLYRGGDNNTYSLLKTGIKKTSYTDASPLTGMNYYKVKAIGEDMESALSVNSVPVSYNDDNGLETGLYMGIIGFNKDIIDKGDMSLLAPNTKSDFISFVNSMTTEIQTLLYYGIDKGLEKLTSTPFPRDLSNVAIVTFTDGLDLGSPKKSGWKYMDRDSYREGLASQIRSIRIQGLGLSSYTIGLRGSDVDTDDAYNNFKKNLNELAFSPDNVNSLDNAKEVQDMAELDAQFQKIAKELTDVTRKPSLKIKSPTIDVENLVRFTFDNVSNAGQSQCYIEGTLNAMNSTLSNVRYVGLTCESGTQLQGAEDEDGMIDFIFENVHKTDGADVPLDYVKMFYWESTYWQKNENEFDKDKNVEVIVTRSSAAIMLVLDCSESLNAIREGSGDQQTMFVQMRSAVENFINTLAAAMDDANNTGGNNTHEYVDLGLPSGTLWATCNVGANSPEEYGDYFAWGETTPKTIYNWNTYKWCNGSETTLTKYCTSSSYGTVDNKTTLDLSDDAAHANWGGSWRMPTYEELYELSKQCSHTWTTQNGVNGILVTGLNGNSIFLPAAGYRSDGNAYDVDSFTYLWSASLNASYDYRASYYYNGTGDRSTIYYGRCDGRSVRPVRVQN